MKGIRLVRYELRKIFSSRIIVAFLLTLLIANVVLCTLNTEEYRKQNRYNEKTQEFVDKVYDLYLQSPGFVLSEYERLTKVTGAKRFLEYKYCEKGYSDCDIFERAYEIFGADDLYHKKLTNLIAQAKMANSNISYSDGGKESYLYRSNEETLNAYTELNGIVTLSDRKVVGWNEYFSYSSEFFLVIGAVTLAAAYLAVADRKTGMSMIIGTSKNGRAPTAAAKYLSVAIFTILIVILFALSSFFTVLLTTGYSDGTVAVQSVKALQLTIVKTSAVGMLFLSLLYKSLAALGFALLLLAIVSFSKSYIFGVAVGFGLAGLCYYVQTLEPARFGQWIFMNFLSFFSPTGVLGHYRTVNLFGRALDLRYAGLILLCLILSAAFVLTLLSRHVKRPRTLSGFKFDFIPVLHFRQRSKLRAYKPKRRSRSLCLYEFFKQRFTFLLLAFLVIGKIFVSSSYYQPVNNVYDTYRREYLQEISGICNKEKREYLENEKIRLASFGVRESEMKDAYSSGIIDIDEYSAFVSEQVAALFRAEVVEKLLEHSQYLEKQYEKTGVWGSFLYDTGYNRYLNSSVDYLLLVFLILFSCRFYVVEQEKIGAANSMYMLIQSTKHGRIRLFFRKLPVNLICATISFAVFKGIDFCFLRSRFSLPEGDAPLFSLPGYSAVSPSLSINGYLIFSLLCSFMGTLLLSVLFFTIAIHLKRTLLSYLAAASLVFIPHFITLSGQKAGNYIDLTQLEKVDRLFRFSLSNGSDWFLLLFLFVVAAAVFMLVFSAYRIKKGIKQ